MPLPEGLVPSLRCGPNPAPGRVPLRGETDVAGGA
jgi:hypothetical protein